MLNGSHGLPWKPECFSEPSGNVIQPFPQVSYAWPPFGKELATRLTIFFTICNFSISRSGFEGRIWVLVALFPGHCILVTFLICNILTHEQLNLLET